MRGTLGFSVLAIFKSVFRFFGFGVHYGLRIFRYLAFCFGFREKYYRVFGFDTRCGFLFFLFDLFGFRLLFDLSGNYAPSLISNSRETQMLLRGMRNKPIQISQGSFSSPREAVPSPPPLVNWKRGSLAFVSPWGEGRVRVHVGQSLRGSRVLNDAQDFDHL